MTVDQRQTKLMMLMMSRFDNSLEIFYQAKAKALSYILMILLSGNVAHFEDLVSVDRSIK